MKTFLLALLVLFFNACSTMEINVDYDTEYDFTNKTNYAIVHSDRVGDNTLVNDRVTDALKRVLTEKNYVQVTKENADLIFVFHVNVQHKSDIRTDYQMIGYGGFGYGSGFGYYGSPYGTTVVATPRVYNYTEGKLIIDALNPKTKKIVWRGIASDEVGKNKDTPDERAAYINKVVTKLMKNFPR